MTLLQAAALRLERTELEVVLAVAVALVLVVVGLGVVLDLAEGETEREVLKAEVAAAAEADEIEGEVLEAEVTAAAEADETEAAVVGVVLDEAVAAAAGVLLDVAAVETIACGAASAEAAKSRMREVGFILMGCWIVLLRSVESGCCRDVLCVCFEESEMVPQNRVSCHLYIYENGSSGGFSDAVERRAFGGSHFREVTCQRRRLPVSNGNHV